MSNLIEVMKKESKPKQPTPEGKSKTWLADVEVHFSPGTLYGDVHHWEHDLVCNDDYLNQMGDDIEVHNWNGVIENADPNSVYVVKGEFHGKWYQIGGYYDPVEWDADFWLEKESVLYIYPLEMDDDGFVIIQDSSQL